MKDLNAVQLIGRLGQDPEVQYTIQPTDDELAERVERLDLNAYAG